MRHIFHDIPGKLLGSGVVNPLYRIEQAVKPPAGGPHRKMLDAMGYPFSGFLDAAFRTTRISRTIFALQEDTDLLNRLDAFFIRTGTDGQLVNIVPGKTNATKHGNVTVEEWGLQTAGESGDYIDLKFAENRNRYGLNDACVWVYVTKLPETASAGPRVIGRISGSDVIRISPFGESLASNAANGRINSTTSLGANPYEPNERTGLWMIQRSNAQGGQHFLLHNDIIIAQENDAASEVPSNIAIGRNSSGNTAWGVAAAGYGQYLTVGRRARLKALIDAHLAII